MTARSTSVLKRCAAGLLLAAGLGGCAVYGPPYAGYDPYYGGGYSTYVGPPVELNLGLGYYDGATDVRNVYVSMTRGITENHAFIVTRGEETALDGFTR